MPEPLSRCPVGVIGLGLMGTAIAERLLEHHSPVRVWNRSPEKARPLLARGARWSDNPLAEVHARLIERAEAAGFGDADNSAVFRAYD